MSFGYFCKKSGFQYASRNFGSLFAQRGNLIDPTYLAMLVEVVVFNQLVLRRAPDGNFDGMTLGQFLCKCKLPARFRQRYVYPMVAAIWSAPEVAVDQFPMLSLARFDKIVSIEILEAVGHTYYRTFFKQIDRLLAPNGIAVIQVITIPDQRYDTYRRSHDWIQKHIFPGGLLPSLTIMTRKMTRHSSLMIEHVENIGNHYATTLSKWHRRFNASLKRVTQLGFDRRFQRKWAYYLSTCEAGFRTRVLGNLQLVLTREGNPDLADH